MGARRVGDRRLHRAGGRAHLRGARCDAPGCGRALRLHPPRVRRACGVRVRIDDSHHDRERRGSGRRAGVRELRRALLRSHARGRQHGRRDRGAAHAHRDQLSRTQARRRRAEHARPQQARRARCARDRSARALEPSAGAAADRVSRGVAAARDRTRRGVRPGAVLRGRLGESQHGRRRGARSGEAHSACARARHRHHHDLLPRRECRVPARAGTQWHGREHERRGGYGDSHGGRCRRHADHHRRDGVDSRTSST